MWGKALLAQTHEHMQYVERWSVKEKSKKEAKTAAHKFAECWQKVD